MPPQGSVFLPLGFTPWGLILLFGGCASIRLSVPWLKCSAGFVLGTDWAEVNKEPFLSTRYTIQDLSSGEKLQVRVKAVSASGTSVPATLEQPVLIREITREYWGHALSPRALPAGKGVTAHPYSPNSLCPLMCRNPAFHRDVVLQNWAQFPRGGMGMTLPECKAPVL